MEILPVLFQKISIQQYPRKKYLQLMGKFPSYDFHLIVGKFTQDTRDTAAPPLHCSAPSGEISELYEIYIVLGKKQQISHMQRQCSGLNSYRQIRRLANRFLTIQFLFFLQVFGNFRREKGETAFRNLPPGDLLQYTPRYFSEICAAFGTVYKMTKIEIKRKFSQSCSISLSLNITVS